MFVYELDSQNDNLVARRISSRCLFLDEVIDVKFISAESKYALLCSNSESLKLLDIHTGQIELYPGHEDIIITLDVIKMENDIALIVTGAKDNMLRLWKFDPNAQF